MWDILARTAFKAILAKFGKKGMTLQEIIEKDKEIFRSDIEGHFSEEGIAGLKNAVETKNGKYFLIPGTVRQEWAERTIQNALDEKIAKPYDPRKTVGNWGEAIVREAFNLVSTENEELPDLISKDGSFYVEVKTSAYNNGGIIKGKQLARFDEQVNKRRFYAFAFHQISIAVRLKKKYCTTGKLYTALTLKSLYLLPFSVVMAHFDASKKKPYKGEDVFVQLNEKQAEHICSGDYGIWRVSLQLLPISYSRCRLHEKVQVITKDGALEHRIKKAFNPKVIDTAAKISENKSQ
ncbi:hypothetical protein KY338_05860 [Candidatus Woesearchaeota archaeon]|nr:hypothetical protein [Candidatus Woesearchaeota archaeon]MBW3006283.1 hypothetical protein [Candidatus Woesearchaeota archaeon]